MFIHGETDMKIDIDMDDYMEICSLGNMFEDMETWTRTWKHG
jgi:hypothetical protein